MAGEQPLARDLALHDDVVGPGGEALDDPALVPRRLLEHGVQDDDQRRAHPLGQLEDVFAVGPREEPELVLDDDCVETVERVHRLGERALRAAHPLGDDLGCPGSLARRVHAGHHADPARPRQRAAERGGEGREPAAGRRERADEPDAGTRVDRGEPTSPVRSAA